MSYEFTLTHRVEFSETDMAGIVHFANFFRMMENTEHAFFRALGFSIHAQEGVKAVGWPRVSATCEYLRPLRFEEVVDVQLIITEIRPRSIRYVFRFWKKDTLSRVEVARGGMTTVCASVDKATGQIAAVPIPDLIRAKLAEAPAELLPPSVGLKSSPTPTSFRPASELKKETTPRKRRPSK